MIVLVAGLLVLFILINRNGEDNLNEFCGTPQPVYTGLWDKLDNLRHYDQEVKKLGGSGDSLCQSQCPCQVPTNPALNSAQSSSGGYRNSHLAQTGTRVPATGPIYSSPDGKKKISDCGAWNKYDKIT